MAVLGWSWFIIMIYHDEICRLGLLSRRAAIPRSLSLLTGGRRVHSFRFFLAQQPCCRVLATMGCFWYRRSTGLGIVMLRFSALRPWIKKSSIPANCVYCELDRGWLVGTVVFIQAQSCKLLASHQSFHVGEGNALQLPLFFEDVASNNTSF